MIGAVARKIFGSANDRRVRSYQPRVDAINALEKQLEVISDEQLRARTPTLTIDSPDDLRTLADYAESVGREELATSMRLETPVYHGPVKR